MDERAELEKQLSEARRKLQELDKKEKYNDYNRAIKKLSEFTDKEKIEQFDNLYEYVINIIENIKNDECGLSEDDEHYAWETLMNIVAKEHDVFWKYFNKINN